LPIKVYSIEVGNKKEAVEKIAWAGADLAGSRYMAPKAVHRLVMLEGVLPRQANIIKQEMLSKGGEAAIFRGVVDCSVSEGNVLLMGTLRQYDVFLNKLKAQPFGLPSLAERIREVLRNQEGLGPCELDCRGKVLRLGEKTLVMGILNVTPDSFSDTVRCMDPGLAVEQALRMVAEGADMIDVGGESTRPGHTPVEEDEEIRRVMPVLERLVAEIPVPVSIDTTRAEVARRSLEAGAHIVNDQWALRADPEMAAVAAKYSAPVILMHNQKGTEYRDLIGDMVEYFQQSIQLALGAGILVERVVVDPGVGFGKTLEQNLDAIRRLRELRCLGRPVLLGTSRKSLIGKTLDLPADQRVEGTAATVAVGIANGADIIRVHDVKEMVRVARMTDAIVRRPSL
jgi:dihydropteroate synthase